MKKTVLFLIILLNLTVGLQQAQASILRQKSDTKVLLIARDSSLMLEFMLKNEVSVMISMLKEAGYNVVVASISGKTLKAGSETLTPDLKLADVKVEDYAGFVIPGMASEDFDPKTNEPEAVEIVKKAAALGKPIAAQLSGVGILGAAGVLKGKMFAMDPVLKDMVPDGIYMGSGVVQDGNIVTSGTCPWMAEMSGRKDGTPELIQRLIALIYYNQPFQATECTAVDTPITVIDPGTVEILKGLTIVRNIKGQEQFISNESRLNGVAIVTTSFISDTLEQGPMWGTVALNGKECKWDMLWFGYRRMTGTSEWTTSLKFAGKGVGEDKRNYDFFSVETVRTYTPMPQTFKGLATCFIFEPVQTQQENVLKATPFFAADTPTVFTNPDTVEVLSGRTIMKGMGIQFQFISDESRCNGPGTLNHNANFDSLGQGPAWGTFIINGQGNKWEGTYYGFREITDSLEWTSTLIESGVNEQGNRLFALEKVRSNAIMAQTYQGEARGFIIEKMVAGIKEETNQMPAKMELFQNYPNPFNPTTTLSFAIGHKSLVTLKVYDILGRELATLVNEEKQAGNYKVTWNAANLPSGVYVYQLKADDHTATQQLMLLK
ncbi:MAG: DJ-1/PfpI family protein [Ignavibacteriales bacterium]